ncbi:MAG: hypothetical protein EHM20_11825, partial [Alphaproteobacteria bacterium]
KYRSSTKFDDVCKSIVRGRSEAGMNVTHIYSLIDENEKVQLFYSEIDCYSEIAKSPFAKDPALIWENGELFGLPGYLKVAYSKLLYEEDPNIISNIDVESGNLFERIRKRLIDNYFDPEKYYEIEYVLIVKKDRIDLLKNTILGSRVKVSDEPDINQVVVHKNYIKLDKNKINKDVKAVQKAALSAGGRLACCNLKPIETIDNFSTFEQLHYHLSNSIKRNFKKILIWTLVCTMLLLTVLAIYSIIMDQKRSEEELKKELLIPLKADFSVTVEHGLVPFQVKFTDLSKGTVEHWDWHFGDDDVSYGEKNPEHAYMKKGVYSVSLEIQNRYHSDIVVKKDLIKVDEPVITSWEKISDGSTGKTNDIFFITDKIFFYVNDDAEVMKTTDGGKHWVDSGNNWLEYEMRQYRQNINSLFFVNKKIGWFAGEGSIYRTNDGGDSWRRQNDEIDSDNYLIVIFKDSLNGRVFTDDSFVFKTTNGGETWDFLKSLSPKRYELNDIHFLHFNLGWAIVKESPIDYSNYSYKLYKIRNEGLDWVELRKSKDEYFKSFSFVDSLNGYLVSSRSSQKDNKEISLIHKTTDGGINWSVINKSDIMDYRKIYFIDKNTGWVLTRDGKYMFTKDGGST